jgi:DNA-binding SARP family transcriptional activator
VDRCVYDRFVPDSPQLSILLLGPPLIEVDGLPLAVDTRKATALLAYLAVTGRAARRETLTGLLWPESGPERARATLRRTLSTLRSALGNRWLAVDGDSVGLDGKGLLLDVDLFHEVLRGDPSHDDLVAAAGLHRGDFLEGFGIRDSAAFDDWQQLEADALRRELADTLDRLAASHASRHEVTQGIACARRRLAIDPLNEAAHRQLMRLYALGGDRSAALEQYRACVRTLDRELGVRPLEETTALYHAVAEGASLSTPAPEAVPSEPAGPTTYPLVGRDAECDALGAALRDVGPDGRLVAIEGEAGIGKTRLVEEFVGPFRTEGRVALSTRCHRDETELAYGLVIELIRAALGDGRVVAAEQWWLGEVARVMPEVGTPPSPGLDSVAAQSRFYEAVSALLLEALDSDRPGVLVVDDAHWADDASLGFLAYLVHRLSGRAILLIVTWRAEEASSAHPLRRLLADAQRDRTGRAVALRRLARGDVLELVHSAGRGEDLGSRLYRETGGLPFFVVEYLDALSRDADEAGDWPIPGGVRDLLEARIATMHELAAQVAAAAAVLGGSFDAETVRDASGRGEEETVQALEELVEGGLIQETGEGEYEFRHEQARGLVYDSMSLARRRLLHRRAADALDLRGRGGVLESQIAQHLALGGDEVGAAERFVAAGDYARGLFANTEALAHYKTALALGSSDEIPLLTAIGDLEALAGDYGSALASYEQAAGAATNGQRAAIEHRIGVLHLRRGEWALADDSLARALVELPSDAAARALADRSLVAHRLGDSDRAAALGEEAFELARNTGDVQALAQAHNALGILAGTRGDHRSAIDHLERSLELARGSGDLAAETAALSNLGLALRAAGEADRALEITRAALESCMRLGDRHREAALRNSLADLLHDADRSDDAMDELKRAVAIFAEVGEQGRLEPEIWKLSWGLPLG